MKHMADLLRSGATLLSQSCPECGSPLFKLKTGEIWCAQCQRRVVIVPQDKEVSAESGVYLESLERAIVKKLTSLESRFTSETDPENLIKILGVIDALLGSLERLRRIRVY